MGLALRAAAAPSPALAASVASAGSPGSAGSATSAGSAPATGAARALRLTVAYPPGGVSDEVARELAAQLEPRLGQQVLVDYRPGAGGAVALEALARSRGSLLELCFSAITPLMQLPQGGPSRFDPARDIAPVAAVMRTPVLVVATPAFGGSSLAEVVAAARRAPGAIRWATSGHATTGHLVLEQVRAAAGVDITHVPYAGGGQQINDALAGHFELLSSNVGSRQLGYLREGRWRALAVGAPQRVAVLPEVPTLAEEGFPAANLSSLFGVFAPGRAAPARLDALNAHINAVLALPAFQQRLRAAGHLPAATTRAEFVRRIAAEAAAVRRLLALGSEQRR
jgi:tripartite-type tricarboxylate transporter receptor subunit TctC